MTKFFHVVLIALVVVMVIAVAGRALLYWKGLTVTSWFRTPWKNYAIGGKWFSLHLIGWGYDVIPVNTLLHEVRRVWPFRFLVESDHIHLQIF
jgi:hypothetical protein